MNTYIFLQNKFKALQCLLMLLTSLTFVGCIYPDDDYEPIAADKIPEVTSLWTRSRAIGEVELEAVCTNLRRAEIEKAVIKYAKYNSSGKYDDYTTLQTTRTDTSLVAIAKDLQNNVKYWFCVEILLKGGYLIQENFTGTVSVWTTEDTMKDLIKTIEVKRTPGLNRTTFTADLSAYQSYDCNYSFYYGTSTSNRKKANSTYKDGILTTTITDLKSNGTYVWLCAEGSDFTCFGNGYQVEYVHTPDVMPGTIYIYQGDRSIRLQVDFSDLKPLNPDDVWFTYGKNNTDSGQTRMDDSSWDNNTFTTSIDNLVDGTTYYFSMKVKVDNTVYSKGYWKKEALSYERLVQQCAINAEPSYRSITISCTSPIAEADLASAKFQWRQGSSDAWHDLSLSNNGGQFEATLNNLNVYTTYQLRLMVSLKSGETYTSNSKSVTTLREQMAIVRNDIDITEMSDGRHRYTIKPSTFNIEGVQSVTVSRCQNSNRDTDGDISSAGSYSQGNNTITAILDRPASGTAMRYCKVVVVSTTGSTFTSWVTL